jgi:hypothetical protein
MQHFIQYHNPTKRGPYVYYPGQRFGIFTDKPVGSRQDWPSENEPADANG